MNRLDLRDTEERLLGHVLRQQAEAIPDAPFLRVDETSLSYGAANERVNALADGFRRHGVSAGDTVALLLDATPDTVLVALALNKLGAIWVPTNPDYKGQWLRETFEDGQARLLVAETAHLERVRELGGNPFEAVVTRGDGDPSGVAPRQTSLEELGAAPGAEPDVTGLHYGDTAAVIWTSGTTGRSKGVMESHNVLLQAAENGADTAGVRAGDSIYSCLPMYHTAAWVANVFRAMVCGIPCAVDPRFSPAQFWDRCRHYDATMIFTLGAMHIFLWQAEARSDDADNPVRVASLIPIPADLEEPFKKRFGIESIFQGYGQSEVLTLFARTPGETWKPNSLGAPQPGMQVALLDDEDRPVPTGTPGELCVRPEAPHLIFNGYFGNPEATLRATRNLWYHTGDLVREDEDGEFFFVDRKADFIRFKGRNISSFAVEHAVGAHPEVQAAAAHGVVSAELEAEAELKVVVVRTEGSTLDAETLARFVNDNAPYFFVPRYIEFVDALPQTPTGRVQKFKLRERGVTDTTWDAQAEGFQVVR